MSTQPIDYSASTVIATTTNVPKLGIGLAYQGPMRPFIEESNDCFNYVEVVPDILWTDLGPGQEPRYLEDPPSVDFIREVRSKVPLIPHAIGLSIGSAHRFNRDHVKQLARWHEQFHFPWHSDHFSYNLVENGSADINVGVTLPLPHDSETLDLLEPRIAEIRARIPIPFLLENNVYYFNMPEQEMEEAIFLNRLCQTTGCGLLLDLHNLYVNSRNAGTDALAFLDRLDLDKVIEIHVAGGMEMDGFYLDAHSGTTPAEVWKLLDFTLPGCTNLGGVTFELFGSWFSEVGEERLRRELHIMREYWSRHQPEPERMSL